jgi:hypothetical protein
MDRQCPMDRKTMITTIIDGQEYHQCPECGYMEYNEVLSCNTNVTDITEN